MKYILPLFASLLFFSACSNESGNSSGNEGSTVALQSEPKNVKRLKNIVFFGTSLTAAYNLEQDQGYPALVQNKIDSLGLPYRCINAGVSGETTADGLSRINWILDQQVDVFVMELGANDALRGLPLKESKRNMVTILEQVKQRHPAAKLVIAGMQAPPNLGEEYTKSFRELFVIVSAKYNAELIPFLLEGVAGEPELNLEDGIHPNVEGQKIVANNVWTVLEPLLKK
ncbi:MAG: arylesterase [Saprospiraceae bacterium]|jgi:acyl-CoA thioesterase-1